MWEERTRDWQRNCKTVSEKFSHSNFYRRERSHQFMLGVYLLVCLGSHKRMLQTGWLKQQTVSVWQFWCLEVYDQGLGRTGSFWGLQEKCVPFLFSSFLCFSGNLWHPIAVEASPWSLPSSSHWGLSQYFSVSKFSLLLSTAVILD